MTDDHGTEATAITADEGHRKLRLLVLVGDAPLVIDLPRTGTVTIGRSRECEARVDHTSVSRKHVSLHLVDGAVTLEDLGSANGTKVNGKPLASGSRTTIGAGTIFEIGKVRAVLAYPVTARGPEGTPMEQTRQLLQNVAKGTISVLLVGETGAGKEVVAREIHERSPRQSMPFVAVNCAALPENLLESELFGYEKGAFTGAGANKPGLVEAANGGTVLLDEIGDMPMATQAKVLRVLETRNVTPLGSVKPRNVDVRFIAATNRDLDQAVKDGKFRDDLLFRISGVTIRVPPLRERPNEIADIAEKLLAEECARSDKPKKTLSAQAIALLESYAWPGNVRELRSAMERAVLLAPDIVSVEHLLLGQPKSAGLPSSADMDSGVPSGEDMGGGAASDERTRIEAALERSGGNQKEAAKLLGITRRALMYRMDRYGLKRPRKKTD